MVRAAVLFFPFQWDFVIGILVGIILACAFFVVQTSRRKGE